MRRFLSGSVPTKHRNSAAQILLRNFFIRVYCFHLAGPCENFQLLFHVKKQKISDDENFGEKNLFSENVFSFSSSRTRFTEYFLLKWRSHWCASHTTLAHSIIHQIFFAYLKHKNLLRKMGQCERRFIRMLQKQRKD